MSANRRHNADIPELTFGEFIRRATTHQLWRGQGKMPTPTRANGRLVRFNRAVRVDPKSARLDGVQGATVDVRRIRWDPALAEWVDTAETMRVSWKQLDWVTPQLGGDPNGTWLKVTDVGLEAAVAERKVKTA